MKRIEFPFLKKSGTNSDDKLQMFQRSVRTKGILVLCTVLLTVILIIAMTTAWYTNVAQTSGLLFETASWGFPGEIQVGEQAIQAAPGTSGIVPFTITNTGDDTVSIDVTVSKLSMEKELRQRIYFYVDQETERGGERMQRLYLSNSSGYSYLLRGQETLTLTEEAYNDTLIHWEWVYDMLGYYVQGYVNASGTSVTPQQYLRPVVYDYDQATFENGILATVDGTTTTREFLNSLAQTDGYAGNTINMDAAVGNFYPVSVEDGSGVWIYLCTASEIETGIIYDTVYVQNTDEAKKSFKATLNFTARNLSSNTVSVDSVATLKEALEDPLADIIKLEQDILLEDTLSLPDGSSAIVDLNGHSISGAGSTLISANSNTSLILSNGTIQGSGGASNQEAIRAVGAEVTLDGMTIQDVGYALVVTDNLTDRDSKIKITDCSMTTAQTAVLLQGNGPASTGKSILIIEDSTISSDYIGVSGQGSASGTNQYWGTDVQIIHSTITGYWAGIYHPQQQSTLTVSGGSVISGYTGIAVKGGEVTIIDSTVTGTGASAQPAAASSGWTDTGDGIYVEATYPWAASVVIKGGSNISSTHRYAVELYTKENRGPGSIKIYGGTFSSDVSQFMVAQ